MESFGRFKFFRCFDKLQPTSNEQLVSNVFVEALFVQVDFFPTGSHCLVNFSSFGALQRLAVLFLFSSLGPTLPF